MSLPYLIHFINMIVDKFSKMAHFSPCSISSDAFRVAKLYFDEIAKLYDWPKPIVAYRDVHFVNIFWITLEMKVGTKHKFFIAYYLQTEKRFC